MADNTAGPSVAAIAISSGILGLLAGYFIGQGASIGVFGVQRGAKPSKGGAKESWPNSYDVKVHVDSSDEELLADNEAEDEDEDDDDDDDDDDDVAGLKGFEDSSEEVKLVLAVRTDLGMTKGKIAAQCGHATLACYKSLSNHPASASLLKKWESHGQPKIAVKVDSGDELLLVQAQALSLGLCARIIHDAGRTQIAAGSATVVGVLGPKSVVDQVTGKLKLL